MEDIHRETIQSNIIRLCRDVNLENVYPFLIEAGMIDDEDVARIKLKKPDPFSQAMDFFLWYRSRGPEAFSTLIRSLNSCGYESVAGLLQSPESIPLGNLSISSGSNGHSNGEGGNYEEFRNIREPSGEISPQDLRLNDGPGPSVLRTEEGGGFRVEVRKATCYNNGNSELETAYEMMSKPRGFALLINNIKFASDEIGPTREGAEFDSIHLQQLFEAFGFEVTVHHDLKRPDLEPVLQNFIRKFQGKKVNACFLAVMSHGHNDTILMHDGLMASIWTDIVSPFNNLNCPALIGLPKMFLISACRGDRHDQGVSRPGTDSGVPKIRASNHQTDNDDVIHPPSSFKKDPEVRDIIVCHSTIPGYVSCRDPETGTWYVRNFCEVFMKNAHNTELKRMLDMVGRKMEHICRRNGRHQVPSYANYGFYYDLYFNPGIYRED